MSILNSNFTNDLPDEYKASAIGWLAEQMPGGFFVYRADEAGELVYANTSCCRIYGCRDLKEFSDLTGSSFRGMVHPDDYDDTISSIASQISDDSGNNMDYVVYRIQRKDGDIRWVEDFGHYTALPGYGDVYYVFINDITENRSALREKERNKMLAEALQEEKDVNKAKTAFLTNMSHEIRTPINTILGMNEMILREADDAILRKYATNIQRAGNALLAQVNDVLDFSKIEAGKMEIIPNEYESSLMIADVVGIIEPRATQKGLRFIINTDENLPAVLYGDNVRIRQVLLNLLSNAVKYTKEGSVTLDISFKKKSDDSVDITYSVTDTGIGIKKEDINRLFDAFERIDEARNRTIEGTGLGINIAWKLLELMNGSLDVKSDYGKGSCFSCALSQDVVDWSPIGDIRDVIDPVQTNVEPYRSVFTAPDARILLVDDTEINLMVTKELLKYTEITVDTAPDGKQALSMTRSRKYDVLLIDHRMPVMDGMEMIRLLRSDKTNPNTFTPSIVLTANAIAGVREKYISAGFDDYMIKPVIGSRLEQILMKYLPRKKVREAKKQTEDNFKEYPALKTIEENGYLNINEGIGYAGSPEMFIATLEFFLNSIDIKSKEIQGYYDNEDWSNYEIKVHALKSSAKIIGAGELSDRARALELAAHDGDTDYIHEHTGEVLAFYGSYRSKIPASLF